MLHNQDDTIAQIATPPGEGGVAIIRISGSDAIMIANRIFSGNVENYASHTAHFGQVQNLAGEHVDDALLLVMRNPRSYTGEDTVEIHCHGGSLITRRVLETVLEAGARAAGPGEFTFRAFLNGKLDLAQAEAVQELICAKNERALDAAEQQLEGALSKKIKSFQSMLTETAAILEAWVDFPEEGLEFATMDEICQGLEKAIEAMKSLEETFHDGKILHDGISLCLVGCPNVGKSSLMNALLGKDRAIVTDIAGTTRDTLEDQMRLNGLNIRLTDTAGIRETGEIVEQEGIRRSKIAMEQADLILLVLDLTKGLDEDDRKLLKEVPESKTIVVWNKSDLAHNGVPQIELKTTVQVSAKTQEGLDRLSELIDQVIWSDHPPEKGEVLLTNVRHKESLSHAIESCERVIEGLRSEVSPEFVAFDMRQSLINLGQVIGSDVTEDILNSIFSKFCIGK